MCDDGMLRLPSLGINSSHRSDVYEENDELKWKTGCFFRKKISNIFPHHCIHFH